MPRPKHCCCFLLLLLLCIFWPHTYGFFYALLALACCYTWKQTLMFLPKSRAMVTQRNVQDLYHRCQCSSCSLSSYQSFSDVYFTLQHAKKKRPADDLEIEKYGTYFICIRSEKVLNSCYDCMNAASSTEMSLGREISWSCGSSVQDCWRLLAIVTIKYPNLRHCTCTAVDDLNSF